MSEANTTKTSLTCFSPLILNQLVGSLKEIIKSFEKNDSSLQGFKQTLELIQKEVRETVQYTTKRKLYMRKQYVKLTQNYFCIQIFQVHFTHGIK